MIPMADNCNHSDVTVVQEIVNKPMHLTADTSSKYFTRTKFMNDYSLNFEPGDYEGDEFRTKNVTGRYSRRNYLSNQQFSSVEKIKAALNAGIQLWDVPCIRDHFTEDNDTEDEDSDSEEEQKGDLDNLNALLTDRRANMKDLKKGFVFFMDQEKKDIKRFIQIEMAHKQAQQTYELDAPCEWWEDG